jgi:hypothetical protein|tara:strand:- start:952 stop:1347 length:396 start_codon:yes stop_codon:yes gene_type:complete
MNDTTEKPPTDTDKKAKALKSKKTKECNVDLDSKIPDIKRAIYEHYGKPDNMVREKFTYYRESTTPAGAVRPAWNNGGWQRGRLDVYVSYEDSGFNKTRIPDEGEGSWFFLTDGLSIKVHIAGKLDTILEI